MNLEQFVSEIIDARKKDLEKRIVRSQRHNPIMSDISSCDRQIVYGVLDWDKRQLFEPELIARFDAGNIWENEVKRELEGLGYQISLAQLPTQIKDKKNEILASGKIDGVLGKDGYRVPLEIKTMNLNMFNQIKTADDLNKKPWLKKYINQLQLYMYGNNYEEGLFIITDGIGHIKLLPLYIDYGHCEWLLQRLERIHENIKERTYPERIPYDNQVCGKCPFAHICLPDVLNKPAEFIDNEQLQSDLDRHEELKPFVAEYDDLHEQIKDTFKGVEKAVVGTKYMVQMLPSERTIYELPPDIEEQINEIKKAYAKKSPVKRLVIQILDTSVAV